MEPELQLIAELCVGEVGYMEEANRRYVYMGGLRFLARGENKQMDALLCLNYPNPSYPTKLYISANLGLGLNWNESPYILGRQWFTWSWKDVSPSQSPFEILAGHLKAFQ